MNLKLKQFLYNFLLILVCSLFMSCSYLIPSKKSQLGYQSYDYWKVDTIKLEKFNPSHLKTWVQNQSKMDYIVFQHYNSCGYSRTMNRRLAMQSKNGNNVILIPVVHDYLYNFQKAIQNPYGRSQTMYYSDKKLYGKTINSLKSWKDCVIPQFHPDFKSDSTQRNFYFIDSLTHSRIFFYHTRVDSLPDLLDSAIKISYRWP